MIKKFKKILKFICGTLMCSVTGSNQHNKSFDAGLKAEETQEKIGFNMKEYVEQLDPDGDIWQLHSNGLYSSYYAHNNGTHITKKGYYAHNNGAYIIYESGTEGLFFSQDGINKVEHIAGTNQFRTLDIFRLIVPFSPVNNVFYKTPIILELTALGVLTIIPFVDKRGNKIKFENFSRDISTYDEGYKTECYLESRFKFSGKFVKTETRFNSLVDNKGEVSDKIQIIFNSQFIRLVGPKDFLKIVALGLVPYSMISSLPLSSFIVEPSKDLRVQEKIAERTAFVDMGTHFQRMGSTLRVDKSGGLWEVLKASLTYHPGYQFDISYNIPLFQVLHKPEGDVGIFMGSTHCIYNQKLHCFVSDLSSTEVIVRVEHEKGEFLNRKVTLHIYINEDGLLLKVVFNNNEGTKNIPFII